MDGVKVSISNKQKAVKIPTGIRLLVRRCCSAVLTMEDFQGAAEVSVSFVDNEQIREMNKQYRNKDAETDVLSFPVFDLAPGELPGPEDADPGTGLVPLGDMCISLERAEEQAKEYGHSLERELCYLAVHSVLHLLGYDHVNGGLEKTIMREKEEEALGRLGLTRDNTYVE